MKKLLIAALVALPVLFSCKKADNGTTFKKPAQAEAAMEVKPTSAPVIVVKSEQVSIEKIEFFRTGRYLITATATKAEIPVHHFSGTYTCSNGVYTCSGDFAGTISVTSSTVSFNNGEPTPATVNPTDVTEGSFEDFLYRSWKIVEIDLALTKPQITQGITCTGTENVSKAIDIANRHNANIDEKYTAYDVKEISLSKGAFMVTFANNKTFGGKLQGLTINANSATVNYEFLEDLLSGFFDGTGSATLSKKNEKLVVSVSVSTSHLAGTMSVILVESL